jgi:hypothetical protein
MTPCVVSWKEKDTKIVLRGTLMEFVSLPHRKDGYMGVEGVVLINDRFELVPIDDLSFEGLSR